MSVWEARPGHWRASFTDETGRRITKYGFRSEQEAMAFETEGKQRCRQAKIDALLHRRPAEKPMTLDQFFAEFWIPYKSKTKRSFHSDLSNYANHIKPVFGATALDAIRAGDVESFKAMLFTKAKILPRRPSAKIGARPALRKTGGKLSPVTVLKIVALLSSLLHFAHRMEKLASVPAITRPRVSVRDPAYLPLADFPRFLAAAKAAGGLEYALFSCALLSGCRLGELAGLEWCDVDFDRRMIRVRRSYNQPTTKSGKVRFVALADLLAPILAAWKEATAALRDTLGVDLVFTATTGQMLRRDSAVFRAKFRATLAAAGLPTIRFHDLRHSYASALVSQGVPLFTVQQLLGHSTPTMTQRYAHLSPDNFAGVRGLFGSAPSPKELPATPAATQPEQGKNEVITTAPAYN